MIKLPKTLRFFRKPDHIAFLFGYSILLVNIIYDILELKIGSIVFFTFTLFYEIYEISKGNRNIIKLDHITFVIAYIMVIVTFWYNFQILMILAVFLLGFTLYTEIYTVRKNDLEKLKRKK